MKTRLPMMFALPMLAGFSMAAIGASADSDFATKAAQGNLAEIAVGRLAVEKGNSAAVKDFGQQLIDDHGKANQALKNAAGESAADLPDSPSPAQQVEAQKLQALSGEAFDRQFASMMVKDHKATITMFKKEAASGQDADLKAFAGKTLPTLEQHLATAKKLAHHPH